MAKYASGGSASTRATVASSRLPVAMRENLICRGWVPRPGCAPSCDIACNEVCIRYEKDLNDVTAHVQVQVYKITFLITDATDALQVVLFHAHGSTPVEFAFPHQRPCTKLCVRPSRFTFRVPSVQARRLL